MSVLMLMIALSTLGLLLVRSTARQLRQAGQQVARERALASAQAAVELAAAHYRRLRPVQLDAALAGTRPQAG
ncbi:MAG: hypothetical protein KDK70_14900, partial [Myxococcales bacterium]|nr:hypothetical protein [Myxococcales bacterium]